MPSRLLDRLAHLIVAVQVEHIRHQVQGILIVLHLRVEARQVEAVGQIVLVDLAEVLVAPRGDELPVRPLALEPNAAGATEAGGCVAALTQSRQ